jgi:hypothetical protein
MSHRFTSRFGYSLGEAVRLWILDVKAHVSTFLYSRLLIYTTANYHRY